jgi:acetyl-CoA synthetase
MDNLYDPPVTQSVDYRIGRESASAIRDLLVKAFVMLDKELEPSDLLIQDLKANVKRTTAPYKTPRLKEFVNELPMTIFRKIKKNELHERERKKFMTGNGASKKT